MFGITITHNKVFAGTQLIATYTKDKEYIYLVFEGHTYIIENNEEVFHNAIDSLCRYGILNTKSDWEATNFVICTGKKYSLPYNNITVLFVARCILDTVAYSFDKQSLYHTISAQYIAKAKKFSSRKDAEEYLSRITNKENCWFVVGI